MPSTNGLIQTHFITLCHDYGLPAVTAASVRRYSHGALAALLVEVGVNRVAGKVALITGGDAGIGVTTAALFVAEGAAVMLVDADAEALARTARQSARRPQARGWRLSQQMSVKLAVPRKRYNTRSMAVSLTGDLD